MAFAYHTTFNNGRKLSKKMRQTLHYVIEVYTIYMYTGIYNEEYNTMKNTIS